MLVFRMRRARAVDALVRVRTHQRRTLSVVRVQVPSPHSAANCCEVLKRRHRATAQTQRVLGRFECQRVHLTGQWKIETV